MKSVLFLAAAICLVGYVISEEPAEDLQKERIVALYRTATYITVITSTRSRAYSCYSATSANACVGRRRRKRRADIEQKVVPEMAEEKLSQLQGSMVEEPAVTAEGSSDARLGFTIWTTSTSSVTLYTTSLNSAVTVVLTYLCTYTGNTLVPMCG